MLDDRKLQSLIAMYDVAIAELRSLDDRGVEPSSLGSRRIGRR
jgi:hypothetical protein